MKELKMEEIFFMHYRIVTELQPDGASHVISQPDRLEAALARPMQSAFGKELFEDELSKAAALTESLINGHPFQDGNKRVGITAGCVFLAINGYTIEATNENIYDAAMSIAKGDWKFEQIKEWFDQHAY